MYMNNLNKTPIQKRSKKTKQLIIETAFRMFLKNGYKKTNTILIAKEAKVSVGVIYLYFKDKKELLDLWLNELSENCDTYFYNQFKLKEYGVELNYIISNIIEKLYDTFLKSPLVYEKGDEYLENKLHEFFIESRLSFMKACFDNEIFVKNPSETSKIILNLIFSYYKDIHENDSKINFDILKNKYISSIVSLLTNN